MTCRNTAPLNSWGNEWMMRFSAEESASGGTNMSKNLITHGLPATESSWACVGKQFARKMLSCSARWHPFRPCWLRLLSYLLSPSKSAHPVDAKQYAARHQSLTQSKVLPTWLGELFTYYALRRSLQEQVWNSWLSSQTICSTTFSKALLNWSFTLLHKWALIMTLLRLEIEAGQLL